MSIGFVAELMTAYLGKDQQSYSVKERTGQHAVAVHGIAPARPSKATASRSEPGRRRIRRRMLHHHDRYRRQLRRPEERPGTKAVFFFPDSFAWPSP
jgi:hypothetical protein